MTTLCDRRLSLGEVMDLKQGDVIPVELPNEVTVRLARHPYSPPELQKTTQVLYFKFKMLLNSNRNYHV